MFNIYQDNMSTNVILPLGHDRTLTIFEWYFAEPGSGPGWESMQQTIAFSDEIQQEDIVICEQVQRGLRSRSYTSGRFSAKRENGVHHFQELVRRMMDDDAPTTVDDGDRRAAAPAGSRLGEAAGSRPTWCRPACFAP